MPPICLHLGIAREVASRLGHPVVEQSLGSFFLGSTAPDIRLAIGAAREETHFVPLGGGGRETGVKLLFQAYPELALVDELNVATKSFIAGYLSHLVTDETWIYEIYRPFFGKASHLGDDPLANLLDRALQFELDRREQSDTEGMAAIRAELSRSDCGVLLAFIDSLSLKRWREFVITAIGREQTWERFRFFAEKYLIWVQNVEPARIKPLLNSLDSRLEQSLQIVPQQQLRLFRQHSIDGSVAAVKEYLG